MNIIKPGNFSISVPTDAKRMEFDFKNEQLLFLKKEIDYVFIGDSITQLWDINSYLNSEKTIVNRGIGGDTSYYLNKRFEADCVQLNPKKVVLMIGTNDITKTADDLWWKVKGQDEKVVLDDYKNNINEIVKKCDDNNIELILCSVIPSDIAPPYDKEKRWKMTDEMNSFLKSLGKTYIDYFSALAVDGKILPESLSPDGIHPNSKAYEIMANVLKETIDI